MSKIEEPQPARPWRPEDGPPPEVWTWPDGDQPALEVWSGGRWRYAPVRARQAWPDGTVRYQVVVNLHDDTEATTVTYEWGHPGLRRCHGSGVEPSREHDESRQAGMPQAPPRRA